MGLFSKIVTGKMAAKALDRAMAKRAATRAAPAATAAGEYIPAGQVAAGSGLRHGGALVDRATEIYRRNPKLVAGIATIAAAAVLAGMKRKPHRGA